VDVGGDHPGAYRLLTATLTAGLLAWLAVAAWSAPSVAAESRRLPSATAATQSGAAQGGYKLKWLPYRPSTTAAGIRLAAKQPDAGTAPKAPIRTAERPQGKAFEDPFGDAGGTPRLPTLAAAPGDKASNEIVPDEPPAEPAPGDASPAFPPQKPPATPPETDKALVPPSTLKGPAAEGPVEQEEKCPSPYDPDYHTKISELSSDTTATKGTFPRECALTQETIQPFTPGQVRKDALGQTWAPTTFTWKASALCHQPLYFEDVQLERYGHSWGPYLQPLASGANFFLSVPALPYKMGLYPPCECIYTLGYYRPGSCAPYMIDPFPLSIRAALAEGGVWTGMVFLIP
jgi:hypothetical protein